MDKYSLEELNSSPETQFVVLIFQSMHVNNQHTDMELYVNRDNVGFCTTGKYWARVDHFLISYIMECTIKAKSQNGKICEGRNILEITFYDDLIEYEAARIKETQEAAAKGWVVGGLNVN